MPLRSHFFIVSSFLFFSVARASYCLIALLANLNGEKTTIRPVDRVMIVSHDKALRAGSSLAVEQVDATAYLPEALAFYAVLEKDLESHRSYLKRTRSSLGLKKLDRDLQRIQGLSQGIRERGKLSQSELHAVYQEFIPIIPSFYEGLYLPYLNTGKNHLGFRKMNDYGVTATFLVEVPQDPIMHEPIVVDGRSHNNYPAFIIHDFRRAEIQAHAFRQEILHFMKNPISIAELEAKGADFSLREWAEGQSQPDKAKAHILEARQKALPRRHGIYREVRSFIAELPDPQHRLLAEAIWFEKDHESQVAYSFSPDDFSMSNAKELWLKLKNEKDLGSAFKKRDWIQLDLVERLVGELAEARERGSHYYLLSETK